MDNNEFTPFPHFATNSIHVGQNPEQWKSLALVPPVSLSTNFKQLEPGKTSGFVYSRDGNPIRNVSEECVAAMEKGKYCVLVASGMAATAIVTHLLNAGDHIVVMDDLYSGASRYFRTMVSTLGMETSVVDASVVDNVKIALQENTKMVWLETPTNPLMKLADIRGICDVVHANSKAFVAVDNTFATPYFQRPLEHGADIVMHSATKYLNGHDDVVMGCVVTNNEELHQELRDLQIDTGPVPSPFDCYMLFRGLKTLPVRMKEHQKNALAIAKYLEDNPRIEKVNHPGLKSHPQYELGKKQMIGYSGMLSFVIKGDLEMSRVFLSNLKVWGLAVSLGGCQSVIESPSIMTHASVPKHLRESVGIQDGLVRMSVGLENLDDLIADLDQALKKAVPL